MLMLILTMLGCSSSSIEPIDGVELTWFGVTSWLVRYEDQSLLIDPFFSRPQLGVEGSTEAGIQTMNEMLESAGSSHVNAILVGHSHFDHAIDVGTAAIEANAQVYGSPTTCWIAQSQDLDAERCTTVAQGDTFSLGSATIHTIRTIHWNPEGFSGTYGEYTEEPDPTAIGWAPNGGTLSFLIEWPETGQSLFIQDSMGPLNGNDKSSEDYTENLEALFLERALTTVWLAPADFVDTSEEIGEYLSRIQPQWWLAHHWDGTAPDLAAGPPKDFVLPDFISSTAEQYDSTIVLPERYGQQFQLTEAGLEAK